MCWSFPAAFFGIVGTAVTIIGASFILRILVNLLLKYVISSGKDDEGSATMGGLEFGAFEYAVIKTVHLGLCQAAGYVVAVAMYTPICGKDSQLV